MTKSVLPSTQSLLRTAGLQETKARSLVVETLRHSKKPLSPYDIQKRIGAKGKAVNTVTVYRIIDALQKNNVVHRHPSSGHFLLCAMPQKQGCHAFLHCSSCGNIEEFHNEKLCKMQNDIARESGYTPEHHVTEIVGICSACKE